MKKECKSSPKTSAFDVVFGIDMETDVGSFTGNYEGVKHGTPRLLSLMRRHNIPATYFWTAHAAQNNPAMVKKVRDAGHEIGCHSLVHETIGDPIFPLPNNWPILPSEVENRLKMATDIVGRIAGVRPKSFRCPRLWGSTKVLNVLEQLGYAADASLPLYYFRSQFVPYHPSSKDWTKRGKMRIVEIPNFCDLAMKSRDPLYNRDRDQWPLFRTRSAKALMEKVASFIRYVRARKKRPVLCFYFHPWEFHRMPRVMNFGEASVRPFSFITQNCGEKALEQFDVLCRLLKCRGARFMTAREIAKEY